MWVDTNVHLELIKSDPVMILARAKAAGVRVHCSETHPEQWTWLSGIKGVYKAYGLHPNYCQSSLWSDALRRHLIADPLACIGEVGLDFRDHMPPSILQIECLKAQLDLAVELDRAVIVHSVKAHQSVLKCLRQSGCRRFTVHAFTGSAEIAKNYLDLGGYLSVGGLITRLPAPKVCSVFATLSPDRLLLETDAPDLPPHNISASEPCHLPLIGQVMAEMLGLSKEVLAEVTRLNAARFFGFDSVR